MYVWTALAVAASTYVYSRVVDRVRRDRLVLVVDALLVLLVLGLRATLNWLGTPFIGVLYVAVEAIGSLLLVQFWSFTDDLFDTRQAKRSFGLVASGGILAALLAGTLAGMISRIAGTENLLPLSALLILACLLIASHLARLYPESFSRQRRQATTAGDSGLGQVLSSAHLRTVAWVVLLTFLVITIVDYQFKLFVRYNYLNREAELTRFLAFFQAAAAGLCLVLQLLVTRKLLQFNILLALFLLPAALLAGSVTLLVLPTFLVAVITKAMDNVLRYSVNDAAMQVLYVPVPASLRGRAKALADGILRPLAQGGTGLVLAASSTAWVEEDSAWLGLASVAVCPTWLVMIARLRRNYIGTLTGSLALYSSPGSRDSGHRQEQKPLSASSLIEDSLAESDETTVLQALEMLPLVKDRDWQPALDSLLHHSSARVRTTAIGLVRQQPGPGLASSLADLVTDPDDEVRAQAVLAYCESAGSSCLRLAQALLEDPVPRVQAMAAAGILRHGGIAGANQALPVLLQLHHGEQAPARQAAALAIGLAGMEVFARDLLPLLSDEDDGVRQEAILAAGRLRSVDLVLPLLARLADPRDARPAERALARFGPTLAPSLRTLLRNAREPLPVRCAAARILSRLGGQAALDTLAGALTDETARLRAEVLEAILRLLKRQPRLRLDLEMLRRAIRNEIKQTYQRCVVRAETDVVKHELLHEHLEHEVAERIGRLFKLLAVLYPRLPFHAIYRALHEADTTARANAIELLEQLLDADTCRTLVPMVENGQPAHLARIGDRLFGLMHLEARRWLENLVLDESEWLAACATDALGRLRDASLVPTLSLLVRHSSPLVRETAAVHLAELLEGEQLRSVLQPLLQDPAATVKRVAMQVLENRS